MDFDKAKILDSEREKAEAAREREEDGAVKQRRSYAQKRRRDEEEVLRARGNMINVVTVFTRT